MVSTTSKRLKRVYSVYERYDGEGYGDASIPSGTLWAALRGGDEWARLQDEWAASPR